MTDPPPTTTTDLLALNEISLNEIAFNEQGLVPAIVQAHDDGQVLMLAWMNHDALRKTLSTGRMWFWSRSRGELWCKGETSGNVQLVRRAAFDCDADALLFTVEQQGRGACHTGERSCFYRELELAS